MVNQDKNKSLRLVLLSFLMLFVELTLIRWIGAQIYNLFFFSNLILLASFLGIGIGFLRRQAASNLFTFSPVLLAMLIAAAYYCSFQYQVKIDPVTDNLDYGGMYFKNRLYPVWLTLPVVFVAVTTLMATLGSEVARQFQQFLPLQAYRLEIIGSLAGILVFALLSFSHTAPLSWGIVICLLFLALLPRKNRIVFSLQMGLLIIILAIFLKETLQPHHFWSSYYKVDVEEYTNKRYAVNVNGLTQQVIESIEQRKKVKPFYFLPYEHREKGAALNRVLIIGAGTGGDVAIALAEGAQQVDAVEIDPRLYHLGMKLNPNQPYSDPRVHMYINDGRAFLQQNKTQYDLIIYALTDALALIPGQGALRLENYLYTVEGLSMAQQHLAPGGVFAIYNYYGMRWLVDRLAGTLSQIYQQTPCIDTFSPKDYWATVLTSGNPLAGLHCKTLWQATESETFAPSTDDHPFLYLPEAAIPSIYLLTLTFIFLFSCYALKWLNGSLQALKTNLDFFLMGAAFLLLETKSIVTFALLFGTTWFVNCLVFIGVLTTVYLSIEIATHFRFKRTAFLYLPLLMMLVLAWKTPASQLLALPLFARFLCASVLTFAPILLANLIFSEQFRSHLHSTEAFGANLLGAVLGGLLEYLSLIYGYQSLILLIAGLYVFALLFTAIREKRFSNGFSPST